MKYEFKTTSLISQKKTSLKVCPSKYVCPSTSSVRQQFHMDTFCPLTIPRGNVTERERERDREMQINSSGL